eukprot:Opistho-1_new@103304
MLLLASVLWNQAKPRASTRSSKPSAAVQDLRRPVRAAQARPKVQARPCGSGACRTGTSGRARPVLASAPVAASVDEASSFRNAHSVRMVQHADGLQSGGLRMLAGFDLPTALVLQFMEQPQQRPILQMTVMGMQPVQQAVHR